MIYVSLDIDIVGESPEFAFRTMKEASVFMNICFGCGYGVTAYQVNE